MNGSGAVNGFRLSYQQRRFRAGELKLTPRLVAIVIVAILVIVAPYVLVYSLSKDTIKIDGYFSDWMKVQTYHDTPDSSNPDIALHAYATKADGRGVFYYIETEGSIFQGGGGGADSFSIFIDEDARATSGYSVRGLGADELVTIIGWNGTLASAASYSFDPGASPDDFNGFRFISTPAVAFEGSQLELGDRNLTASSLSKTAIVARHTALAGDWSEVNFRPKGTAVRAVEVHNSAALLALSPEQLVLSVDVSSKGPGATLSGLRTDLLGNVTPLWITAYSSGVTLASVNQGFGELLFNSPLALKDGQTTRIDLFATFPATAAGGSFGLELNGTTGIITDAGTWTIHSVQTGERVAYIEHAPSSIAIDGAFADWESKMPLKDMLGDAYSSGSKDNTSGNVDIDTLKVASTSNVASFFMSVNGSMLGGSSIPANLVRWNVSGTVAENVTNITGPMLGADFAFIFIDTDMNQSTGFEVGGSEVAIGVIGKGNSIMSSILYSFTSGQWVEVGPAVAAIDSYRLETSMPYSSLGIVANRTYAVTFFTQDWSGREDNMTIGLPARTTAGVRAYGGIILNELLSGVKKGATSWVEIYNSGPVAIDISGWTFYGNGGLLYTFPTTTVLQPGEFLVVTGLNFGKSTSFQLFDTSGATVDQVTTPPSLAQKSYGREGWPPWDVWDTMKPTPGTMNTGQLIPEFGVLGVLPAAIVPIMLIAIRRRNSAEESPLKGLVIDDA